MAGQHPAQYVVLVDEMVLECGTNMAQHNQNQQQGGQHQG